MKRNRPKILILEDSIETQLIVKSTLSDYDLTIVSTIESARKSLISSEFDLYVLDVELPDGDGMSMCKLIRDDGTGKNKPILFLSARSSELDRLNAFSQGADDYVVKPFSALELRARVQAKLRGWEEAAPRVFNYPPLIVDLDRRKAFLNSNSDVPSDLGLTTIEFDLLVALCERPEVAKSRQMLLEQVWGSNFSVTGRTIDVHIYKLRKKLEPFGEMLQATHGHGYYFTPPKQKAS